MNAKSRVADRVHLFFSQKMADWTREYGKDRGFRSWATRELQQRKKDLSTSTVIRYTQGPEHEPDQETLIAIIDTFKVRPDFFLLPRLLPGKTSYRDYLFGTEPAFRRYGYEACERFIEHDAVTFGVAPLTESEKDFLRAQQWPGEPQAQTYNFLLLAFRSCTKRKPNGDARELAARER